MKKMRQNDEKKCKSYLFYALEQNKLLFLPR